MLINRHTSIWDSMKSNIIVADDSARFLNSQQLYDASMSFLDDDKML
jgi:hypothetical protein